MSLHVTSSVKFDFLVISRNFKFKILFKFISYYLKLHFGVLTGRIYMDDKNVDQSITIPFNTNDIMSIIDNGIRNTLQHISLENNLAVTVKKGFEHLGYGCFATRVFNKIIVLTQGNAAFFFATPSKQSYILMIVFQAIAKVFVTIKIENTILTELHLPSLSNREIIIPINPQLVSYKISKIIISTNRLWSPHFLEPLKHNVPVGVGIIKLEIKQKSND